MTGDRERRKLQIVKERAKRAARARQRGKEDRARSSRFHLWRSVRACQRFSVKPEICESEQPKRRNKKRQGSNTAVDANPSVTALLCLNSWTVSIGTMLLLLVARWAIPDGVTETFTPCQYCRRNIGLRLPGIKDINLSELSPKMRRKVAGCLHLVWHDLSKING